VVGLYSDSERLMICVGSFFLFLLVKEDLSMENSPVLITKDPKCNCSIATAVKEKH